VESAKSSAGGEVEIGAPGAGAGRLAMGACQGVGAGRSLSRGCRLPIRWEMMAGILPGPRRPRLTLFVCGENLVAILRRSFHAIEDMAAVGWGGWS
jgi:hypothetical protein